MKYALGCSHLGQVSVKKKIKQKSAQNLTRDYDYKVLDVVEFKMLHLVY